MPRTFASARWRRTVLVLSWVALPLIFGVPTVRRLNVRDGFFFCTVQLATTHGWVAGKARLAPAAPSGIYRSARAVAGNHDAEFKGLIVHFNIHSIFLSVVGAPIRHDPNAFCVLTRLGRRVRIAYHAHCAFVTDAAALLRSVTFTLLKFTMFRACNAQGDGQPLEQTRHATTLSVTRGRADSTGKL